MKTEVIGVTISMLAAADLSAKKNLLMGIVSGTICGNGAIPLGVLLANTEDTEYGPVAITGTVLVFSGAAVTAGVRVQSDAAGKAITFSSGEAVGYALDEASGADELIRVFLAPHKPEQT